MFGFEHMFILIIAFIIFAYYMEYKNGFSTGSGNRGTYIEVDDRGYFQVYVYGKKVDSGNIDNKHDTNRIYKKFFEDDLERGEKRYFSVPSDYEDE